MQGKKISDLGITGRKLVLEGSALLVVGILLILFEAWLPEVAILLFLWSLIITECINIVLFIFKRIPSQEPLVLRILKLIVMLWLAEQSLTVELPIWLMVILLGIYQIFMAMISGVTYYIYVKDRIRPRARLLWDTIWLGSLGISSLLAPANRTDLQLFILGIYLIRLGYANIRDGFFFEAEVGKKTLRRRVRVSLPLGVVALIPRATLQKINDHLSENQEVTAEQAYDQIKDADTEPNLEIFIHVTEEGFGAIGHVDLCYQGKVISFGNYDTNSERLFGMAGDGVLFETDREKYIAFCQRESHKTLLGYGLALNEEQIAAVEAEIRQIKSHTIPWTPSPTVRPKNITDKEEPMYAYQLMKETGANLYKFVQSKFKTYFVLSTNCVLLADSIVGKAGTDILNVKGFIAPGTYQAYLDTEFEKPHSMVVTKKVYQARGE